MKQDELTIAWEGADGRRLAELRALFLARSEGGAPAATTDYWSCERDLALYDATLGERIGWRWDFVLDEAAAVGARAAREPARRVVDLGCGSGVAARAAWRAGWIGANATVHCVDRSVLAARFAAERLRREAPTLEVLESAVHPAEAPDLLLIGHLALELDEADLARLLDLVRRARTTVWVEPGARTAAQRLVQAREQLRPERVAIAPCPHRRACALADPSRARDWCHHFPEPPAAAFTEPLPGKTAHELGLDPRSLATSYLVLEESAAGASGSARVLGRPRIEKGRARVDLCLDGEVVAAELSKRTDPSLWRAWKRPGRERLLYRVDLDGRRILRAEPVAASATIRPIAPEDDQAVARVIRAVMPEFGAEGDGFAITDPEVDSMSAAYNSPRSAYFVIEERGRVLGGGGIAPLEGGDDDTCELRKMYFQPELRGRGLGRALLERCLEQARAHGFRRCYIETLTGMDAAMSLYESTGFSPLSAPLGATGHHGCDRYYMREL